MSKSASSVRVKWVVNKAGEPTSFRESEESIETLVGELKSSVFAESIERGFSVRLIFLGRELDDAKPLSFYLKTATRGAASSALGGVETGGGSSSAGTFGTEAGRAAGADSSASRAGSGAVPEVTIHSVLRPRRVSTSASVSPESEALLAEEADPWPWGVLSVTLFLLLLFCWHHRLSSPSDFTPFSTAVLLLFTAAFVFVSRGIFVFAIKATGRCLARGANRLSRAARRSNSSAASSGAVPERRTRAAPSESEEVQHAAGGLPATATPGSPLPRVVGRAAGDSLLSGVSAPELGSTA